MKNVALRIYLAHGDDASRRVLEAMLKLLQHEVVVSTSSSAVFLRRCQEAPPDVAIVGTDLNEDVFSIAEKLGRFDCCPVVVLIRESDVDRTHRKMDDDVMGILVQPVHENDLRPAIYLAKRRFEQASEMRRQAKELERQMRAMDDGIADEEQESW